MQYFNVHKVNPQARLIRSAASIIRDGGVVVFPTDSCYALGCQINSKSALQRIRQIRDLDKQHNFTLLFKDFSEIGAYAKVDTASFRLMKSATPGPYTFLLMATADVPKRLQHFKRKTVGVRIPDYQITHDLLVALDEPLFSTSLILPGEDVPLHDPKEMAEKLHGRVDLIIDGGSCGMEATTVVDLIDGEISIVRKGIGDIAALGM